MTKPPPCFRSSSIAAEAMSYRENDVSTIPIRFRPFAFDAARADPRAPRPCRVRPPTAAPGAPSIPPPSSRSCAARPAPLPTSGVGLPPPRARVSAPHAGNRGDRDGRDRSPPSPLHGPQTPRSDDVLAFQQHEIPLPSICLCIFLGEGSSVVRHHLADGRGGRESGHDHEGGR